MTKKVERSWEKRKYFVGFDWGKNTHAIVTFDPTGKIDASVISSDRRCSRFVSGDLKLEKLLLTPTSSIGEMGFGLDFG